MFFKTRRKEKRQREIAACGLAWPPAGSLHDRWRPRGCCRRVELLSHRAEPPLPLLLGPDAAAAPERRPFGGHEFEIGLDHFYRRAGRGTSQARLLRCGHHEADAVPN